MQTQIIVRVGARIKTQTANRYNRRVFVALATPIRFNKFWIPGLGVVYGDVEEV